MSATGQSGSGEQRRGGLRGRGTREGSRDGGRGGRDARGGRGGRGGGPGGRDRKDGKEGWQPKTKLGRLVLSGRIKTIEEIFAHAIPIKEPEIVDHLLGESLKDEVMKIKPVQKQTRAGQRTRFKAVVAAGDSNGHVGLGIKTAAEVANAIKGALIYAKLAILPVRRGYWGNKIGQPHTVPNTVTGKCGSIRMRLIPAPRGSGIVAGSVAKKLLAMAGFEDVFTSSIGHTKTTTNFLVATYKAIEATYEFLTPDQWADAKADDHPFVVNSQYLGEQNEIKVQKVSVNLDS
jgi:small subunit ribosomal protein S2e